MARVDKVRGERVGSDGTLLLIGVDQDMLGLWRDVLAESGFRAAAIRFEPQFSRYVKALRPMLILCDELKPGLDGEVLFSRLHESPEFSELPFVLMTDDYDGERVARCLDSGMSEVLAKPFDIAELAARLRKVIRSIDAQLDRVEDTSDVVGFRGDLAIIGLPDLLINLSQNQRTGVLQIHMNDGDFALHFQSGQIISVYGPDAIEGRKALYRAIRCSNTGTFLFDAEAAVGPTQEETFHNVANLVLSAVQEADEYPLTRNQLPQQVRIASTDAGPIQPSATDLLRPLLRQPASPADVETLIDASPETDLTAAQGILELVERRILIAADAH